MFMKTLFALVSFPGAEEEEDQNEDAQNGGSDRHGVEHGDHR
jgi:hypothetical protein